MYKIAANIVGQEMAHKEIALIPGEMKKYFASAITPAGCVNHLASLIEGYQRVYMITGPVGLGNQRLLNIIAEGAIYRGIDVEAFYCPMKPEEKMEHLLIPDLHTAFVSLNAYHDLEPWERDEKIILVDMNEIINWSQLEMMKNVICHGELQMNLLIESAVSCIKNAKKEHDQLESYYIPNMDFKKIDQLKDEIIGKIEENVL